MKRKSVHGPDFLVIGAMKAGTTTLYRDLLRNPLIYFPVMKEPGHLSRDEVLTRQGWENYRGLFQDASDRAVCGDGSTIYSKRPDICGVPERAERLLRPDFKVIYLVRNPIERAVSHYRHLVIHRGLRLSLEEAIETVPQLISYGRYAYQLAPWLQVLGRKRICVVRFEDYIMNRAAVVSEISRFLGVEPCTEGLDENQVFNATQDAPIASGPWNAIRRSRIYRRYVRPLLSPDRRERLRALLLPRAENPEAQLTPALRRSLRNRFQEDSAELAAMLSWKEPIWSWRPSGGSGE